MSLQIWLDPSGTVAPPPGRIVVDDDLGLLGAIASRTSAMVRGERLCRWARAIAQARGIDAIVVSSPAEEMRRALPGLPRAAAESLAKRLGDRVWHLPRPVRPRDIAETLWGDHRVWHGTPGLSHAASWLLRWIVDQPVADEAVLLAEIGRANADSVNDLLLARAYAVANAEEAESAIGQWLGIGTNDHPTAWPADVEVTPMAAVVRRLLRTELAQNGLSTLSTHWWDSSPESVRPLIAPELASFLTDTVHRSAADWIGRLTPYLEGSVRKRLEALRNAQDPGLPPSTVEEVLGWFADKYLPWTEAIKTGVALHPPGRAAEIGAAFSRWYLNALPGWLAGADDDRHLAWVKAGNLGSDDAGFVTLLVVLDGVGPRDGKLLVSHLRARTDRLTVTEFGHAFALLPTVTELTKPALVKGVPPGRTVIETPESPSATRAAHVLQLLRAAEPGSTVRWLLVEPDRTYHRQPEPDVAVEVEKELFGVANHLLAMLNNLPPEVPLRIVITADHGRLGTDAERKAVAPRGLRPHGRAAWGPRVTEPEFGGPFVEAQGLIWLRPADYELPGDSSYVMVAGDHAFHPADAKGGDTRSPHGGAFPEEVLVPWIALLRDEATAPLLIQLKGSGQAGKAGSLAGWVANPNPIGIRLVGAVLETRVGRQEIDLAREVPPRGKLGLEISVSPWPAAEEESGRLSLKYRVPAGDELVEVSTVPLIGQALYRTTNILEDLL
jgi:hypothetical protein